METLRMMGWNHRLMRAWVTPIALAIGLVGCRPPAEDLAAPQANANGVVVVEVAPGSALDKAGLQVGDILSSWQRLPSVPANSGNAHGELVSDFDWRWLVVEHAPRGTVWLSGQRDGQIKLFEVVSGTWEAQVRPALPPSLLASYLKARELMQAEDLPAADLVWEMLRESAEAAADSRLRCWFLLREGEMWVEAREWEKAHAALRSALEVAQDSLSQVTVLQAIGMAHWETRTELEKAAEAFTSAQEIRERTWGKSLAFASGLMSLGAVRWTQRQTEEALSFFEHSLKIRERLAPGSLEVAKSLNNLGLLAFRSGELDRAAELFEQAREIRQHLAPGSLELAKSLNNLGRVASRLGDLEEADKLLKRAFEIRVRMAPNSPEIARSLNNLGKLAFQRGELEEAHDYHNEALEIWRQLAADSREVASGLNNLGNVAYQRGDLVRAEEYYVEALRRQQQLAPGSLDVASSLNNLGNVADQRGELEKAEENYEQALQIRQRKAPGSLGVAISFNSLGNVAFQRGELDKAQEYYEKDLEITQQQAPGSLDVAGSLISLGNVAFQRGELDKALAYNEKALEITQEQVPGSLEAAHGLTNLGVVFTELGGLEEAHSYLETALEIAQEQAPDSLEVAAVLNNLGIVAHQRKELEEAQGHFEKALQTTRRLAPDSSAEAEILHAFARLHRDRGRLRMALDFFRRALAALEHQVGRLGGSRDSQAVFRAQRVDYYRDTIALLLELNQPQEAFHTLERWRAQSFLTQLAERDLVFSDVPAELDRERRSLAARYDRVLHQLAELDAGEGSEEIETLHRRLRELRGQRNDVAEKVRQASPRLADLRYPEPLDLRRAQEALDPGTLMLSYSVGKERTDLFVVTREAGLRVERLPIGEDELRDKVVDFIDGKIPLAKKNALFAPSLVQAAEGLYETLVQPAEDAIETSRRVLIIADGPLHLLPFAALRRNTGRQGGGSRQDSPYLVEWKPLHSVLSATVYAELKQQRRSVTGNRRQPPSVSLAAFGDPLYPGEIGDDGSVDVHVRAAAERGYDFSPLPYTRLEVRRITSLFPSGTVRAYLAAEATEERAKSLARDTPIVHFAAHSQLDDRFPLNSFVALTIPEELSEERDNGLLQAWEIFEQVRLDADLVVLSACDTGRGTEVRGEGLMGLARAFQYAGARSVLATLWSVADDTTAHLMARFYGHLQDGKAKDEALRAAQLELIREPIQVKNQAGKLEELDASSPYSWAAFQIIGDWQ